MVNIDIKPWLTAINRTSISSPLKKILDANEITNTDLILDYGCGHGFDLNFLKEKSYNITGYDKYIHKHSDLKYKEYLYDKIICFYVLNTIAEKEERLSVIEHLLSLLKQNGSIYIAVRSIEELNSMKNKKHITYNDGLVTSRKTFQKYFSKEDVANLLKNIENINFTYIKFDKKTLLFKITKKGLD